MFANRCPMLPDLFTVYIYGRGRPAVVDPLFYNFLQLLRIYDSKNLYLFFRGYSL